MKGREITPPEGFFRSIHLHIVIEFKKELDEMLAGLSKANILDGVHDTLFDAREEMKT